jgi:hypothetical protein
MPLQIPAMTQCTAHMITLTLIKVLFPQDANETQGKSKREKTPL